MPWTNSSDRERALNRIYRLQCEPTMVANHPHYSSKLLHKIYRIDDWHNQSKLFSAMCSICAMNTGQQDFCMQNVQPLINSVSYFLAFVRIKLDTAYSSSVQSRVASLDITLLISMPTYKFYYFPARGAGEPCRLVFHLAGVEFEDIRLNREEWLQHKPSTYINITKLSSSRPRRRGDTPHGEAWRPYTVYTQCPLTINHKI